MLQPALITSHKLQSKTLSEELKNKAMKLIKAKYLSAHALI